MIEIDWSCCIGMGHVNLVNWKVNILFKIVYTKYWISYKVGRSFKCTTLPTILLCFLFFHI